MENKPLLKKQTLLVIDFYNLMHRSFHAYPKNLQNSKGVKTNAAYGFTNVLVTTILNKKPSFVAVAFETDRSFRQKEFKDYKENRTWRKDNPEDAKMFDAQVPIALSVLKAMNIPILQMENYEADDIIGSLSQDSNLKNQASALILSSDQDMLQLVNKKTQVLRPARPPYLKEKIFDKKEVLTTFGFEPKCIPDYKALRGDPSDNVPGVAGIGEKTAKDLIIKYKNIETIYKKIDEVTPEGLKQKLIVGKDSAYLSKRLTTIVTNLKLNFELNSARVTNLLNSNAQKILEELEFYSVLKKLSLKEKGRPKKEVEIDDRQLELF